MPIQIELTQGKVAIIDDADWDLVSGYRWYAMCVIGRLWYARTDIRRPDCKRSALMIHRLILGITDRKVHVDHIDGDGLNNRRSNLRACSHSENLRNHGANANNKSGFKGVSWREDRGKWRARIKVNRKEHSLGYYDTAEEAHMAYCRAAIEMHGEFANFGAR